MGAMPRPSSNSSRHAWWKATACVASRFRLVHSLPGYLLLTSGVLKIKQAGIPAEELPDDAGGMIWPVLQKPEWRALLV